MIKILFLLLANLKEQNMKDLFRFTHALLILLCISSANVFSSQIPGEYKQPVNTPDNDPQRIIAGPVRSQNDKTEIT